MSKAENTKNYIVEMAAPVFNTKGYAGTSMSELVEITGLTKGAIYGNFSSKDELAVAVFRHSVAALNENIGVFLAVKATPVDKLRAYPEFYRRNWKKIFARGGCPVQNAAVEADDNLGFMKKEVQSSILGWTRQLAGIIEEGKCAKMITQQVSASDYACEIISALEGGIMLAKIMNDTKYLFSALNRIEIIINNELIRK